MKIQLHHLDRSLESLPSSTSCRGISDLTVILTKYKKILDFVNSYNNDYKRATLLYYNNIKSIGVNIELSAYAESLEEKTEAFESAKDKLRKDIQALLILIRPQEELVKFAV